MQLHYPAGSDANVALSGEGPTIRHRNQAVLERIGMNVVEHPVRVSLVAGAIVPVIAPDLPARAVESL